MSRCVVIGSVVGIERRLRLWFAFQESVSLANGAALSKRYYGCPGMYCATDFSFSPRQRLHSQLWSKMKSIYIRTAHTITNSLISSERPLYSDYLEEGTS